MEKNVSPSAKPGHRPVSKTAAGKKAGGNRPDWAEGIRELYDSVVNEPLPDSFDDLLKKLDQSSDD